MYKSFIEERYGCEFIEFDNVGWLSYTMSSDICYLQDMYIVPEHRRKGYSQEMAAAVENIARDNRCTKLMTTVNLDYAEKGKGDRANMYAILKFGFNLIKSGNNYLVFRKDI